MSQKKTNYLNADVELEESTPAVKKKSKKKQKPKIVLFRNISIWFCDVICKHKTRNIVKRNKKMRVYQTQRI